MRAGIFSGDASPDRADDLLDACSAAPPMAGADLAGEVTTHERLRGARRRGRSGSRSPRSTSASRRMHARALAAARHASARAAGHRDHRRHPGARRRTGSSSPTARATRPPPTHEVELLRERAGPAASRSSASASATSSSAGPRVTARTSCSTATAASTSRCSTAPPAGSRSPRTTTASRSTPRSTAAGSTTAVRPVEVCHVYLNDDVVEGLRAARPAGVLGAVPPGGRGRPARRRLPVRPLRRPHGRRARRRRLMPRRTDIQPSWSSAPARSSSARPASSTTPAPRPAGCCARRACGSSWSTPTRPRS